MINKEKKRNQIKKLFQKHEARNIKLSLLNYNRIDHNKLLKEIKEAKIKLYDNLKSANCKDLIAWYDILNSDE